jgi:hypothetical protein
MGSRVQDGEQKAKARPEIISKDGRAGAAPGSLWLLDDYPDQNPAESGGFTALESAPGTLAMRTHVCVEVAAIRFVSMPLLATQDPDISRGIRLALPSSPLQQHLAEAVSFANLGFVGNIRDFRWGATWAHSAPPAVHNCAPTESQFQSDWA